MKDCSGVVSKDDQARSSGHIDQGEVEHGLFLLVDKSRFNNDWHRRSDWACGLQSGRGDEYNFFLVRADHNLSRPNVFAQALGENDIDGSDGLLGLGGMHAFDLQLRFERAADFAGCLVVEGRTVRNPESKSSGTTCRCDIVRQLASGVSERRSG